MKFKLFLKLLVIGIISIMIFSCNLDNDPSEQQLLYDYFPISIGNTWTFDTFERYSPYGDGRLIEGTETWEIKETSFLKSTIKIEASFEGQITYYWHLGGSETKYVDTSNIFTLVKRNVTFEFYNQDDGNYTLTIPSLCAEDNTNYFPGMRLLKGGMPLIDHTEDTTIINHNWGSWSFKYGVGPLSGRYGYRGFEWERELKLVSYELYP